MSSPEDSGFVSSKAWEPTGDPSFEWNGLLRFWRQLESKVRCVVDVGTGSELTFPDNGSVVQHCFEPEPKAYDRLVNFRRPHIYVNRLALGDKEEKGRTFYEKHGETFHYRTVLSCKVDCDCQIKVDVTTLDAYFQGKPGIDSSEIDLLNLAVSGHEHSVLCGATETLKRTKIVLLEYGSTYKDASVKLQDPLNLLQAAGFSFLALVAPQTLVSIPDFKAEKDDGTLRYYVAARSAADMCSLMTPITTAKAMDDIKFGQQFLHLPTLPAIHTAELPIPGFNLALANNPGGGFLGLLRRTRNPNGTWANQRHHKKEEVKYPETESYYILLHMDRTLKIVKETEMKDVSSRTRHKNYSTGVEDCRFVSPDGCVLATTLDTNPHWKAEMSVARFSPETGDITSVQPINNIKHLKLATEKNWLHLRHWGNEMHLLQWVNPIRILRIDCEKAEGEVVKEITTPSSLNIKAHGGAAVQLPDGTFLVTIREYRRTHYAHSRWFRLDDQYQLIGVSPPFRFQNKHYYEMCMSLCVVSQSSSGGGTHIVAAVSLEDKVQFIFTFLLDTILRTLKNK